MGGFGLAVARDIVELALYREQGGGFDVLRTHALDFPFQGFSLSSAAHQFELLEYGL